MFNESASSCPGTRTNFIFGHRLTPTRAVLVNAGSSPACHVLWVNHPRKSACALFRDQPCLVCTHHRSSANHKCKSALTTLSPSPGACALKCKLGMSSISIRARADPATLSLEGSVQLNMTAPALASAQHQMTHFQRFCQCCDVSWQSGNSIILMFACVSWKGRDPLVTCLMAVDGDVVVRGGWNDYSILRIHSSHWSERPQNSVIRAWQGTFDD